jgi:hypothetical protein
VSRLAAASFAETRMLYFAALFLMITLSGLAAGLSRTQERRLMRSNARLGHASDRRRAR